MEQLAIHNYLANFFTLNKCSIKENQNGKLTVELTEDLDRLLLNRPFYWEYIKKMGQEGTPATLTFLTNPNRREEDGEWIHFGSPRLHQIFQFQMQHGRYLCVYEQTQKEALKPWLTTNVMISFKGRQKRDELLSIALNLINGVMVFDFMEKIKYKPFSNMINDYCFTISPIIKVQSGYKRIEEFLKQYINGQEHDWAEDAYSYFNKEKEILTHFYESYLEKANEEEKEQLTERYKKEISDLEKRLIPEVDIKVINGGLFYLTEQSSVFLMKSTQV